MSSCPRILLTPVGKKLKVKTAPYSKYPLCWTWYESATLRSFFTQVSETQDKKFPLFDICDIFVSELLLPENYGAYFPHYVKLIILPVTSRQE